MAVEKLKIEMSSLEDNLAFGSATFMVPISNITYRVVADVRESNDFYIQPALVFGKFIMNAAVMEFLRTLLFTRIVLLNIF